MLIVFFHRRNRTFAFAVLMLLLVASRAQAQPPTPELLCLSAETDGISLNWAIQSGTFTSFRVLYRQTEVFPLQAFESIDFPSTETSGKIVVTDALSMQYEVFMVALDGTTLSADSKTLRTIKLSVTPEVGEPGIARITWNALHQDFTGVYKIYRSIDDINYNYIAETTQKNYLDKIEGICEFTTFYYRIVFESQTCNSTSVTGISATPMKDENPPADPVFTYLTIDEQGYAVLNWTESSSVDVEKYQFEVKEGVGFSEHTSIPAPASTFRDDHDYPGQYPHYQDPCSQVVTYVIKAVDNCGTSSAQAVYEPYRLHNTIWLRVESETNCKRKASLTWNRYNNMNPAVSEYRIMRSQNGGIPVAIGSLSADNSETYTYTDDELLTPGDLYTYHIKAVNNTNNYFSESCRVEMVPDPDPVETFNLENVTVTDDNYIDLSINGTPLSVIESVEILRSDADVASLEPIKTINWDNPSQIVPENTAEVDSTAYYYQIKALDACGFEIASSDIFRSIYLQITLSGSGSIRLNWNAFEGWGSNLSGYNVYCQLNEQIVDGFPVFVPAATLVYNDLSPDVENGRLSYYVEALRNDMVTSRSNEVLIIGDPEIILPSAFTPDGNGLNDSLAPLAKNIETTNYLFIIYNRWGQKVYETNSYPGSWDGKHRGAQAPAGIYAYIVKYSDYNGLAYSKRGSVILLR